MAEERNAIFAGGCFWCMEPPFAALPGVLFETLMIWVQFNGVCIVLGLSLAHR